MNKYKITVSTKAREQLLHHTAFIAKVSKDAAKRLVTSFKETTLSLEEMPKRCPWFNRDYIPYNKYRYCIFEKRYALIFQIKEDIVFVDYVIDFRQDLNNFKPLCRWSVHLHSGLSISHISFVFLACFESS